MSAGSNSTLASATTTVASPCNSICTIDAATRLCIGCYRSLDEIASWMQLSDEQKREVIRALPARREREAR